MSKPEYVRLSRFVTFIPYGDFVELQQTARARSYRIDKATYDRLRVFAGFRLFEQDLESWLHAGVLVAPFVDTYAFHGPAVASEAELGQAYQQWYWCHEIESEREYEWLGKVAVKMPSDLFFYQELLSRMPNRRVLELGYGRGGGLWFFASILSLLGGGAVIGLDIKTSPESSEPSSWPKVPVFRVHGDVFEEAGMEKVRDIAQYYDLVVADLGGSPLVNVEALIRWAPIVANRGTFVLEDLWGTEDETAVVKAIDAFLISNSDFGLCESARRFPMLKGLAMTRHGSCLK